MRRLDLETDLRRAIEARDLQVLYQPICRTGSTEIAAFEALCRWEVADPVEFVTMAEETGLIVPLGHFVLEEAARAAAEWGVPSPSTSPPSARGPAFAPGVKQALVRSARGRATSSSRSPSPRWRTTREARVRTLTRSQDDLGIRTHLDDFGTGASSLRFLHRFPGRRAEGRPLAVIGMLTDPGSMEIVKAVVGLAHNLGMEVVGEGVETAEHLDALEALGCELVQGFHLSSPLTAEAAAHLLLAEEGAAGSVDPATPFLPNA
jgi:EAL domain-containing protein (putative c-di-GMP-specific phosphodiesterase class I)